MELLAASSRLYSKGNVTTHPVIVLLHPTRILARTMD